MAKKAKPKPKPKAGMTRKQTTSKKRSAQKISSAEMASRTEPSRPTVKRLFKVSGDCCAFPKCKVPVIDPETHSIICEICHIKGEKPGSARFDPDQLPRDRQSFDNLILMCGQH